LWEPLMEVYFLYINSEVIRHEQTFRGVKPCPKVESVIKAVQSNAFGDAQIFDSLFSTLRNDFYLIHRDFDAYLDTMEKAYSTFKDKDAWARKSILAAASMGTFSSDR
jgi:starch phosphorylase